MKPKCVSMPHFIYSLKAKHPGQYIQWRIKEGSTW